MKTGELRVAVITGMALGVFTMMIAHAAVTFFSGEFHRQSVERAIVERLASSQGGGK